MDLSRKLQLLDEQIAAAAGGQPSNFQSWKDETDVVLRAVVGANSPLYEQFKEVRYSPQVWWSGMDSSGYRPAGVRSVISILNAAKKEVELVDEVEQVVEVSETPEQKESAQQNGRVFIVHGHDDARKHELARFLRALTGTEPVILHEQPNEGKVLLEKLEHASSSAGYAVVLLTGDDIGCAIAGDDMPRARQNVIFELGFFFGTLGRRRVSVLKSEGLEPPGDIDGLVYIPLDAAAGWRAKLAGEIENAGLQVDWRALSRA